METRFYRTNFLGGFMNKNMLLIELQKNNINENICLIDPVICPEGALCLKKDDSNEWDVILNERGEFLIKEHFNSENDACRFFLKKALTDPTNRKDFNTKNLIKLMDESKQLLKKYRLDD